MAKLLSRMTIGQSEESTQSLLNELMQETAEEKEEREKINIEIEELAKQLEAKNLLEKKKNVTISIFDSSRIESLELSIKNGVFANNSIYGDCRTELFNIGHTYLSRLIKEFEENTNNESKFYNDYIVAVNNNPSTGLNSFKDAEIRRLTDIKNLILKCSGVSEFYRSFNLYFVMCNYLEFLQQPEPAACNEDTAKQLIIDKSIFENLTNTNYPTIDPEKYDCERIYSAYINTALKCSRKSFYAWLVYGKKYEIEKIEWTYKTKSQLKLFIDAITESDTAKESYFNTVFGITLTKSDYKNSNTLDDFFDISKFRK